MSQSFLRQTSIRLRAVSSVAGIQRLAHSTVRSLQQHPSRVSAVVLALLCLYLILAPSLSLELPPPPPVSLATGINVNGAGIPFLLKCSDVPVTHAALLEYITNVQEPAIAALQNYTRDDYLHSRDHHKWLIIEMIDSSEVYGGLGDRTRGMMGALLTAMAFDRAFKIEWITPVALSAVYDHTLIDWQQPMLFYNDSLLKEQMINSSRPQMLHRLSHNNIELDGWSIVEDRVIVPLARAVDQFDVKFVTIMGNRHMYTDISSNKLTRTRMQHYGFALDTDIDPYYPCLHSALFTLNTHTRRYVTAMLEQQDYRVDYNTEQIHSLVSVNRAAAVHLMCYQHRSGGSGSAFIGEPRRVSLDYLPTAIKHLAHKVYEESYLPLLQGRALDVLMYVTADSNEAVNAVQQAFNHSNSELQQQWPNVATITIPGDIIHIDLTLGETKTAALLLQGFRKTVADFWLMGVCDSGIVSQGSGFALLGLQRKQSSAAVLPVKLQVLMESGKLAQYKSYQRQFAACSVADKCKLLYP